MSFVALPQREEGGQDRVVTSDERVIDLLEQILNELKKIEYHLMDASDIEFEEYENA